VAGHEG
jgi:hypothetical protein